MNTRERTLRTLQFNNPDMVPLHPGHGRQSTRERWHGEGLPRDLEVSIAEYAYRQAGGTCPLPAEGPGFPVDFRMRPCFEEKVIEEKENSRFVQDWKGNICEIGKEFDVTYLRNAVDFVTRRWIKCPVESWGDWETMKKRYDPADPGRFPENASVRAEKLRNRDWTWELHFDGPFWIMREWLGFENLCTAFYDTPDMIRDMVAFWQDFCSVLLKRIFSFGVPDIVHISEDMAYKKFSMISPDMAREFLLPCYRAWGDLIRTAGCPMYAVDSDGYIGELIPVWIEAGVNACDPIEVAAGNDINRFRKEFGRSMAYRGGVDKRAMAKGGTVIEREIDRIRPVIDDGGYIPSCDHGVPADVSWPDFVHYTGLLARATGWL